MTKKMKEGKKERWKDGKMGQKIPPVRLNLPAPVMCFLRGGGGGGRLLSAERPQLQRVARFITFI